MKLEPGLSQETRDIIASRRAVKRERPRESLTADPVAPELNIIQAAANIDIPVHLLPLDKDLRVRWSIVTAHALFSICLRDMPPGQGFHVLVHMIANGPVEFERVMRPAFEGNAFKMEDYDRMYRVIKARLRSQFGLNKDFETRKLVIANG